MTKEQYWKAHVAKNPKFVDDENEIRISVKMLRRLMEEAFDKGYEHSKKTSDVMKDLFKGFDFNKYSR